MSGHGWVIPLPNGARARCGGPGLCHLCNAELREQRDRQLPRNVPVLDARTMARHLKDTLAPLPRTCATARAALAIDEEAMHWRTDENEAP